MTRNLELSRRALEIQESPIRKLNPLAFKAKQEGVKVYHLNIGQPDIPTPKVMMDGFRGLDVAVLSYGPADGLPEYKDVLAKYYQSCNIPVEPSNVIVTMAGSEAINFAFLTCLNPGEEVIVFEPFYTNYNGFASMCGVKLVPVGTSAENGYAPPEPAVIEEKISPNTRAILLCSPNNPTGYVLSRQEMEGIASLASKHNLFVISDEVYREFTYDGLEHTSILHIDGMQQHAVIVDSISKRYSACGARVGCLVSLNRDVMKNAVKFAQARLCPATADQKAASMAIKLPPSYFDEIRAKYQSRRDTMMAFLDKMPGVIAQTPKGAFYVLVKFPIENAEDFTIWLLTTYRLNNQTTMIAPGEGFYATPGKGRDEARLAYVLEEEDVETAMHILEQGLAEYRKTKA